MPFRDAPSVRLQALSGVVLAMVHLGCGGEVHTTSTGSAQHAAASSGSSTSSVSAAGGSGGGDGSASTAGGTNGGGGDGLGTSTSSGGAGSGGASSTTSTGRGETEIVRPCALDAGVVHDCGDTIDNDDDGLVDAADPDCYGPCQRGENSFDGRVGDPHPCLTDCYFDPDPGPAYDTCEYSWWCDPHSLEPPHDPTGSCFYEPDRSLPDGTTCHEAVEQQPAGCTEACVPRTPNGCDCFGCCELPAGSGRFAWLGSFHEQTGEDCGFATMDDPETCRACTPVPSCFNPCDPCEVCIGGGLPAADCGAAEQCAEGVPSCGLAGQPLCPEGTYCITGCCQPLWTP